MADNIYRVRFDSATAKWFAKHGHYVETTLVRCADCELFYKPELGHKCKKSSEPCIVCRDYIKGAECKNKYCPVAKMKAQIRALTEENCRLRNSLAEVRLEKGSVFPDALCNTHETREENNETES